MVAHKTGHRIGAIRQLRWPKRRHRGQGHPVAHRAREDRVRAPYTPVTAEALAVLEEALERNRGNKDSPGAAGTAGRFGMRGPNNPFRFDAREYKEHEIMRGWREDEDECDETHDDPPIHPESKVVR